MSVLTGWISNIILFILLGIVVDMLLPNSSFRQYVKMVVGLLLIVIILSPVLNILSFDVEALADRIQNGSVINEQQIENLTESKKKEIQAGQRAYILEQMAVHLENQAKEELVATYGMEIRGIDFSLEQDIDGPITPESIKAVHVYVEEAESEEQVDDVQAISVVNIDTSQPIPEKEQTQDYSHVQHFLAKTWEMPENQIIVAYGKGEGNE